MCLHWNIAWARLLNHAFTEKKTLSYQSGTLIQILDVKQKMYSSSPSSKGRLSTRRSRFELCACGPQSHGGPRLLWHSWAWREEVATHPPSIESG